MYPSELWLTNLEHISNNVVILPDAGVMALMSLLPGLLLCLRPLLLVESRSLITRHGALARREALTSLLRLHFYDAVSGSL
jgi:hypothetical protein